MSFRIKQPEKIARIATIATLSFVIAWGAVMVFAQVKPFWIDEARVIYNLKFKNAAMLWGQLDYLQQFPRVYLQLVKLFTATFDYSYTSLRIPSFIVGTLLILFSYRLMNKLYSAANYNKFLFILILVSASTFTDYYVEIKQYTMDLLLGFVAIWQLLELVQINNNKPTTTARYLLLCTSFLAVPFFSYTYPIAIAPAFMIQLTFSTITLMDKDIQSGKTAILAKQVFPLFLCGLSIALFYLIDVNQLMGDKDMHQFWGHLMMKNGFSLSVLTYGFYNLFAEIGSGMLYWYIFGILGIISFLSGAYNFLKYRWDNSVAHIMQLYSILLLIMMIILFLWGKYPLGEPRLNAFAIPAISMLIIRFLDHLNEGNYKKLSGSISVILFLGLIGNIFTTCYAGFTEPAYAKKMTIYRATERALQLAEQQNIPIMITPGVVWPYDKTINYPYHNTVPGDWVLKTFPAYHVSTHLPVYPISKLADVTGNFNLLPASVDTVLAGDGEQYTLIGR